MAFTLESAEPRDGLDQHLLGRARAAIYMLAYGYGRMVFSATQDWLTAGRSRPPFCWPGTHWQDFVHPLLDGLTLLMLVWVLLPALALLRATLCDDGERPTRPTISIRWLLAWTTIAAVVLIWIRFLTWKEFAPRTVYSSLTPAQAWTAFLTEHLPCPAIVAAAVIVAAWALSGRWWQPVAGLLAALLIDGFGHHLVIGVLKGTAGSASRGGVLSGPLLEHWSYLMGRNGLVWGAFGVAALTGVYLLWAAFVCIRSVGVAKRTATGPSRQTDVPKYSPQRCQCNTQVTTLALSSRGRLCRPW